MDNEIGKKIKELRTKAKITQKQLAKLIGCTEIMVSRYELGISQVSINQLQKISKILNIPVSFFFNTINETTSKPSGFKSVFVFDLDDTLVDGRQFCGETIARVITNLDPSVNFDLIVQLHESVRGRSAHRPRLAPAQTGHDKKTAAPSAP